MSLKNADTLIQNSPYADFVEDHEYDGKTRLHRYFLSDGQVVIVTRRGKLHLIEASN